MSSSSAPAATFTSTWRQLRPRSIAATSPCTNPVLICLSLRRARICSRRVELGPLADSKQATLHAEVNGGAGSPTYITLCRPPPRPPLEMPAPPPPPPRAVFFSRPGHLPPPPTAPPMPQPPHPLLPE